MRVLALFGVMIFGALVLAACGGGIDVTEDEREMLDELTTEIHRFLNTDDAETIGRVSVFCDIDVWFGRIRSGEFTPNSYELFWQNRLDFWAAARAEAQESGVYTEIVPTDADFVERIEISQDRVDYWSGIMLRAAPFEDFCERWEAIEQTPLFLARPEMLQLARDTEERFRLRDFSR